MNKNKKNIDKNYSRVSILNLYSTNTWRIYKYNEEFPPTFSELYPRFKTSGFELPIESSYKSGVLPGGKKWAGLYSYKDEFPPSFTDLYTHLTYNTTTSPLLTIHESNKLPDGKPWESFSQPGTSLWDWEDAYNTGPDYDHSISIINDSYDNRKTPDEDIRHSMPYWKFASKYKIREMSQNDSFSGWTIDTSDPYIISTNESTKIKAYDSRMLPFGSTIEDIERVGKWLVSPKGLLWVAKQVLWQSFNTRHNTRAYNLASAIGSAVPAIHIVRTTGEGLLGFSLGSGEGIYSKWIETERTSLANKDQDRVIEDYNKHNTNDSLKSFAAGTDIKKGNASLLEAFIGTTKSETGNPTTGEVGISTDDSSGIRYIDKEYKGVYPRKWTRAELAYGDNIVLPKMYAGTLTSEPHDKTETNADSQSAVKNFGFADYGVGASDKISLHPYGKDDLTTDLKDIIPFKIYDIYNNMYIIFRAAITSITDSISGEWNDISYIGRPESFPVYTGVKRTYNIAWNVYIGSKSEFKPIWTKINYLMGLQYPNYENGIMTAPIIKLTLADLLIDMPGYFSSLTISYPDGSPWEIDTGIDILRLPKHIEFTADFTPLYHEIPRSIMSHIDGVTEEWMKESN